ncbi:MAG: hypothetical protein LBD41_03925 [Clostridiales Family XIII bacterium]|nr:hypothetical protein [Clostridiales Family XIII bacterium]
MKNKSYYDGELANLHADYGVALFVFYGKELFNNIGVPNFWTDIMNKIGQWRESIPDLLVVINIKVYRNIFRIG